MKNGSYKWWLLAFLSMAFLLNQTDRVLFGLLTDPIQRDLGLDERQVGLINTALFATVGLITPFAGALADRLSRKWIVTVSLIGWSVMTVLTGFVGGFLGMVFFRSVAAGVGEACYSPAAIPMIAAEHTTTRSLALSVHQSTLYVGIVASGACIGALFVAFGESWRALFWLFGGVGVALGVAFIWCLRPERKESVGERLEVRDHRLKNGIMAFFGCPSALLIASGAIAIVIVNNAYLAWAPKFAMAKFGLSVGDAALGTMTGHHLAALGAIYVSGFLTDRLCPRYPRFRLGLQIGSLLVGCPAIVAFGLATTPAAAWTAATIYGVARGFFEANTYASIFDVVRPEHRSTAVGLLAMLAFLLGSLSPLYLGGMCVSSKCAADPLGVSGFGTGFATLGGSYFVAALLMAVAFGVTFRKDRITNG